MRRLTIAALIFLALLGAACSDESSQSSTPTSAPESPSPGVTPTGPDYLVGKEAIPLTIGDPVGMPDDVALIIETGCTGCDGPTTGLLRAYTDSSGAARSDTLFSLETIGLPPYDGGVNSPFISGFAIADDLSEMVVSVCIRGTCTVTGLNVWSPDSLLALYRSTDGGITWTNVGELPAGLSVRGILGPQRYVASRAAIENAITYEFFPGGEAISPPAGATWMLGVIDNSPIWLTDDSRVLRSDGSVFADFGSYTKIFGVWGSGSAKGIIWYWSQFPPEGKDYLSLMRDGVITDTYLLPALTLSLQVLDKESVLASIHGLNDVNWPSLIALGPATIQPMTSQVPEVAAEYDRHNIVAIQRGPFARVVNTGACLNIRESPTTAGRVRECVADGVLLTLPDFPSSVPPGVSTDGWLEVISPAGTRGWAGTAYLEY